MTHSTERPKLTADQLIELLGQLERHAEITDIDGVHPRSSREAVIACWLATAGLLIVCALVYLSVRGGAA